ncbi:MAG: flagellin, partial [Oscillospiraceae bacterium]|nr:flagellin [Oscillospiraceae bacterium]
MRIQHNIMAMSAYRNYTNNVSAMKKNLEKLSSGYKINRAGDDAAGLAISEKMRAQITGLETAQKNAKDGISLVQTAEGALTEVHDMLNRMVELATQSANGTYDNTTDRKQMQKEIEQLKAEINRIADSSNFNGIKLLDGTLGLNTDAFEMAGSADAVDAVAGGTLAGADIITGSIHGGSGATFQ